MNTISVEPFYMVLSLVDIETLRQIRLVNKQVAVVAAEHLFSEVTVFDNEDSYQRLVDISTHPVISNCVRHIIHHNVFLNPELSTYNEWKSQANQDYDYEEFAQQYRANDHGQFLRAWETRSTLQQRSSTTARHVDNHERLEFFRNSNQKLIQLTCVTGKWMSYRQPKMAKRMYKDFSTQPYFQNQTSERVSNLTEGIMYNKARERVVGQRQVSMALILCSSAPTPLAIFTAERVDYVAFVLPRVYYRSSCLHLTKLYLEIGTGL
ncbi:hypothetical protein EJ05DRAFT_512581 [Pseudovirgaria hyperparasitica]|uniref:F-box domain-containing protein n=1 Tax=Pseudovirgaria hyperparasitica TaxID=470096 RepID=A0A6A6W234_9PEZI|nr:uncharacterized protein EJ05DRAFT_512581 [Pseudovirgaria hyperparasitica]KAF2756010.1 hypothetical protein EJ05DRAFT_512581 [Pseudovirgaria hyperparasitica]